jgi:hypothetical protein
MLKFKIQTIDIVNFHDRDALVNIMISAHLIYFILDQIITKWMILVNYDWLNFMH